MSNWKEIKDGTVFKYNYSGKAQEIAKVTYAYSARDQQTGVIHHYILGEDRSVRKISESSSIKTLELVGRWGRVVEQPRKSGNFILQFK